MRMFIKITALVFLIPVLLCPNVVAAAKESRPKKIPIDLYVMSHCPFGVQAENNLLPIAKSFGDSVDLRIHFIASGTVTSAGIVTGFHSLHGPAEAEEDFRQVCIQKNFPDKFFNYVLERNNDYLNPDWLSVAKKTGLFPDAITSCITSHEGVRLFFENTKTHLYQKAFDSPTIYIKGVIYKGSLDPRSLATAVCGAFPKGMKSLPRICSQLDSLPAGPVSSNTCREISANASANSAPPVFDIHIVVDDLCPPCTPTMVKQLQTQHPGAIIKVLSIHSEEGRALIQKHKATFLPLYILDKGVESDPNFSALLASTYQKSGDSYIVRPMLETYSPDVQLGRTQIPHHLDLFVRALASDAYKAEFDLLNYIKSSKIKDLTFSMHFIVPENIELKGRTMNTSSARSVRSASANEFANIDAEPISTWEGPYEVQESLRQVCLFQKAPLETFFSYLACRNQNLKDPAQGQRCFIPNDRVTTCMEKGEGEELLRRDSEWLNDFVIKDAAMFVWENKYGPFVWKAVDWKGIIEQPDNGLK